MRELKLTKDEKVVLQYMINRDDGDPLKDIYEIGVDEPEDPYAALKTLKRKVNAWVNP